MTNARNSKSAREKAAQMRAEAERKAAKRRGIVAGSAVLAVILIAVGATIGIRSLQQQQREREAAATAPPSNLHKGAGTAAAGGGFLVGTSTAKLTVDVYEDFLCPACKNFEAAKGPALKKYAADGKIALVYHPVAILDRLSSTQYSTRAAAAMAAVINTSPAAAPAYHDLLFANQPPENGPGLPDEMLIELAQQAGANRAAVEPDITSQRFAGWVTASTEQFAKSFPPGGTPTVTVNGEIVKDLDTIETVIQTKLKG